MSAGRKYSPINASTPELGRLQDEVSRAVDRLDAQAQTVSFPVRVVSGGEQLGSDPCVIYYGKGAASVTLPSASILGNRRGLVIFVATVDTTATLTVKTAGNDTIVGLGSSVGLGTQAKRFTSDGASRWFMN